MLFFSSGVGIEVEGSHPFGYYWSFRRTFPLSEEGKVCDKDPRRDSTGIRMVDC